MSPLPGLLTYSSLLTDRIFSLVQLSLLTPLEMGVSLREGAVSSGDGEVLVSSPPEKKKLKLEEHHPLDKKDSSFPNNNNNNVIGHYAVVRNAVKEEEENERPGPVKLTVRLSDGVRPCRLLNNSSLPKKEEEEEEEVHADNKDNKTNNNMNFSTNIPSEELVAAIKASGHCNGNISTTVTGLDPSDYAPKAKNSPLTKEELLPETPCIYVNSKEEAFSSQLYEFCLQRPIVMIRNLTAVIDMDLTYYCTKALVDAHPHHPVEVRLQMEQSSDENWNPAMTEEVWYCTSSRSYSTVAKFAEYQAGTLEEYFNSLPPGKRTFNPPASLAKNSSRKMIKFGTNCDLLMKRTPRLVAGRLCGQHALPCGQPNPGDEHCSALPQENNNFCAVNVNIGPGTRSGSGTGRLLGIHSANVHRKESGLPPWLLVAQDRRLGRSGDSTYRFMQKPGDIVWINAGCVHWVQAAGWCNNIAWNVGPMTHRQYRLAIERYEWNKKERYQSIVAMVFLSWNLARNIRISDERFYRGLKRTLMHSLRQIVQTLEYASTDGGKTSPPHYCGNCDEEVFNILFVKENEKRYVVHCLKCIRQYSPSLSGVVCLEEYHLSELLEVYDNFRL
ncbi:Lysine-specific demethylase 6A, partial [Caligus rogercresseyi]